MDTLPNDVLNIVRSFIEYLDIILINKRFYTLFHKTIKKNLCMNSSDYGHNGWKSFENIFKNKEYYYCGLYCNIFDKLENNECIYFINNMENKDKLFMHAAKCGNIKYFEYGLSVLDTTPKIDFGAVLKLAINNGHLNFINYIYNSTGEYIKKLKIKFDPTTLYINIIKSNNPSLFEYMFNKSNGSRISTDDRYKSFYINFDRILLIACLYGNINAIHALLNNNNLLFTYNNTYIEDTIIKAIEKGNIECVLFLFEKGYKQLNNEILQILLKSASNYNRLDLIRNYENVISDIDTIMVNSVVNNNLELLKYINTLINDSRKVENIDKIIYSAYKHDDMVIIDYLICENIYTYNETTMLKGMIYNSKFDKIKKYVKLNKINIDFIQLAEFASYNNKYTIFKYLYKYVDHTVETIDNNFKNFLNNGNKFGVKYFIDTYNDRLNGRYDISSIVKHFELCKIIIEKNINRVDIKSLFISAIGINNKVCDYLIDNYNNDINTIYSLYVFNDANNIYYNPKTVLKILNLGVAISNNLLIMCITQALYSNIQLFSKYYSYNELIDCITTYAQSYHTTNALYVLIIASELSVNKPEILYLIYTKCNYHFYEIIKYYGIEDFENISHISLQSNLKSIRTDKEFAHINGKLLIELINHGLKLIDEKLLFYDKDNLLFKFIMEEFALRYVDEESINIVFNSLYDNYEFSMATIKSYYKKFKNTSMDAVLYNKLVDTDFLEYFIGDNTKQIIELSIKFNDIKLVKKYSGKINCNKFVDEIIKQGNNYMAKWAMVEYAIHIDL